MSEFEVYCPPVSDDDALRHAAELERVIGEIANGRRKASHIPMEPMVALIQFARDRAASAASHNTGEAK